MTITVPVTKVSIFLRWTSWLIRHALARKHDFVIINCDETMLSNLQCWSHGTFITRARTPRITSTSPACTPRELRMTLLAAMTNEPELQNRLPQVFLPKTKKGGLLSPDDLTIWEQFQSPLEVWHGSSGWVTQIIFKKWLTHVRRVVHRYRSTAWVVLLLDCSRAHDTWCSPPLLPTGQYAYFCPCPNNMASATIGCICLWTLETRFDAETPTRAHCQSNRRAVATCSHGKLWCSSDDTTSAEDVGPLL